MKSIYSNISKQAHKVITSLKGYKKSQEAELMDIKKQTEVFLNKEGMNE